MPRYLADRTRVIEQRASEGGDRFRNLVAKCCVECERTNSRERMPDCLIDERGCILGPSAPEKGLRGRDCDHGVAIVQGREQHPSTVVGRK